MELPPEAPKPRLCHLVKWPDFDGYGFNLHAEKSKIGQYIGKVDGESPALHAGLLEGDKIIEVNGVNISNENHRQVVERIKSVPNETRLLVIDELGDKWYKERKITIKSTQSNVIYIKTPVPKPVKFNGDIHNQQKQEEEEEKQQQPQDEQQQHVNGVEQNNDNSNYSNSINDDNSNNSINISKECESECKSNSDHDQLQEAAATEISDESDIQPHIQEQEQQQMCLSEEKEEKENEEKIIKNADENHNINSNDNNNNTENKEMVTMKKSENNNNNDNSLNDKEIEVHINHNNNNNNNSSNKNNNHIDDNKVIEKAKNIDAKKHNDDGSIASSSPHSIKKMSSNSLITENSNSTKRPSSIASEESNSKTGSIPGSPVSTKSGSIISKDGMSSDDLLNLNMSASEMRKLLAQRKKTDPKKVQMDLKQKYEIIQQM